MTNFNLFKALPALGALALLSACGDALSGTYTDEGSGNLWTFKEGTVSVSNHGMSMSGYRFRTDGNKIIPSNPDGSGPTLELELGDNNCISGPGIMDEACKS